MIIIKTKRFPPEGYDAVLIFPFLFTKVEVTEKIRRHEQAHEWQYLLCVAMGLIVFGLKRLIIGEILTVPFLILPFVLFYIIWGVGFIFKGYNKIWFETWAIKAENK